MSTTANTIYQFGPAGRFQLDAGQRVLCAAGQPVALAPKLFDTLFVLVANAGRLVEKEELLRLIWPDSFVEENSLNKNIHALRRLFAGDETPGDLIETIPKRGYRFNATVKVINGPSGATLVAQHTRTSIVIEEEIADEYAPTKLAVLPFRTLGEEDGAHLGAGLADALITRLSNIRLLHVRPTAATLKYDASTGEAVDASVIGRELQVDVLLDGSIRRLAERIRVTVQLISVSHAAPLWAAKFDERFTDIFAVEDSISEQVADALLLKLTGDERRLLAKRYTGNIAAYELYLRGIHQLNTYTAASLRQAVVFFSEAVKHDPAYALAYARLAGCYNLLYVYSHSAPPLPLAQLALTAAERALALDDNLAEAQAAAAQVKLFCAWQTAEALAASQRAVALKPHSTFANLALGWALAAQDRLPEGVAVLRLAQQNTPHSPGINVSLGHLLAFACLYDEAASFYQQALMLTPQHPEALRGLGLVNILRGREAETLQSLGTDATPYQRSTALLLRCLAYARLNEVAAARQVLAEAQTLDWQEYLRPIHRAAIHAELAEPDQAFVWLERAFAEREPMLVMLAVHPFLDKLHSQPRFAELRRRLAANARG